MKLGDVEASFLLSGTTEEIYLKVCISGFYFRTGLLWIVSHQSLPVGRSALDSRAALEEEGLCMHSSSSCLVTTEIFLLHCFLLCWAWSTFILPRVTFGVLVSVTFNSLSIRKLSLEKLRKRLQLTFIQHRFELRGSLYDFSINVLLALCIPEFCIHEFN